MQGLDQVQICGMELLATWNRSRKLQWEAVTYTMFTAQARHHQHLFPAQGPPQDHMDASKIQALAPN